MSEHTLISIGGDHKLTIKECQEIARNQVKVTLDEKAYSLVDQSRKILLDAINRRIPIYGITTQFGNGVNVLDANLREKDDGLYYKSINERQLNLIKSHNCGLGEEVPVEITRASMALRAHCLGLGYSGVRPVVVEALINFLNNQITPTVFKYGSVGASGDLIPLSAIATALAGEDTCVYFNGKKIKATGALRFAKLHKLQLETREGLALINGTSFATAIASLSIYDLQRLFPQMLSALAMALEALSIIDSGYAPLVHELKKQKGEIGVNDFLLKFWQDSKLIKNLEEVRKKIFVSFVQQNRLESQKSLQDYYSLRSIAQGFGPFKENLEQATTWIENEMNSVNDNPIIDYKSGRIYHSANFMGYYITEACDILKIDIAQASSWIHAVLANLVHPRKSYGLPTDLISRPEIYSGFKPIQILAASITVQNRKLAQAQQAYMLPTEGDNQDVNSLAAHAAFDFREALENIERLVAILFLAATQALELRGVDKASFHAKHIYKVIRREASFLNSDRSLIEDIKAIIKLMQEKKI